MPALLSLNHSTLVQEKLEPLQAYLRLSDAELKKMVVSKP